MLKKIYICLILLVSLATCANMRSETRGIAVGQRVPNALMFATPMVEDAIPAMPDLRVGMAEVVSQLTGAASTNATADRWNVYGTDLGHMFMHNDDLYMMFGDTYGPDGGDWRSNVLARIADPDPRNGFSFASMTEANDGTAAELVRASRVPGIEWTVIPTNAVSAAGQMVMHYMSVRAWGEDDKWYVRRSGLASSQDDGQTWTRSTSAVWPAGTGFEQVSYVQEGGWIYVVGIPQGRFGGAKLGRVIPDAIFDPASYEYWDGANWVPKISAATNIVPPSIGELSVEWSEANKRWLMMYYEPNMRAVVLRHAPDLTGPWSDMQIVADSRDYPGLYAPYIVPGGDIDGELYFTMSRWKPLYNVFLMKTRLAPDTLAAQETTVSSSPPTE
ncbi:DUF4185 domain-containing protein [Octadecabacter sp. G9-8]|uniref:DUF4185 domain-containing protein n=1 Tax=Octadecabacter dasysiphoniae TaxID=2909341 RepID=A0ABS9CT99_9RHOB|nr:DUF4185 domain-containing protein [Octadecabacter dasysiphoniae]MCF2870439.1 DUF4185 domain-containing protein [Octadecabacter dasysiphoniae]